MLTAKGLMSHEYDNESLGSVTTKEFFHYMSDCWLLKNGSFFSHVEGQSQLICL